MEMLWQLKNLKTNEPLNDPQKLPENWGPIFGLHGIKDRLGDLSWLGPDFEGKGWIEVGPAQDPTIVSKEQIVLNQIQHFLKESDAIVAADNTNITKKEFSEWIEYRKLLREIPNQLDFPEIIRWPAKPK